MKNVKVLEVRTEANAIICKQLLTTQLFMEQFLLECPGFSPPFFLFLAHFGAAVFLRFDSTMTDSFRSPDLEVHIRRTHFDYDLAAMKFREIQSFVFLLRIR